MTTLVDDYGRPVVYTTKKEKSKMRKRCLPNRIKESRFYRSLVCENGMKVYYDKEFDLPFIYSLDNISEKYKNNISQKPNLRIFPHKKGEPMGYNRVIINNKKYYIPERFTNFIKEEFLDTYK